MFPAVVRARRRNIHAPDKHLSGAQRRPPSDGTQPHSPSPGQSATSCETSPEAMAEGRSWMLRRDAHGVENPGAPAQEYKAKSQIATSCITGLSQNRNRQAHNGFNATCHTNDRAVALACVATLTL